ncbi:MAG: hypothetical protein LBM67_04085 [Lentimicrobiaceae bacterium]|jgi:Ni/Co efflux regulator RcnB|nr:hypothetical protein [Lentimicrobiaceae bacterium]
MKKIILSIMFLSFLALGTTSVATAQEVKKEAKKEQTVKKTDCSKDCQHKHEAKTAATDKKACCSESKTATDKKACCANHADCKNKAAKGECCKQAAAPKVNPTPEVKKDTDKK